MAWFKRLLAGGLAALFQALPGVAEDLAPPPLRAFDAGRVLMAGGGQVPWAVPGGYGLPGGAFGFSYQRQWFGGGLAAGRFAPGSGVEQDVIGAGLRLAGDQDTLLPQLAIGMQYKVSADPEVVRAMGGRDAAATDAHVSATKLFLDGGLRLNATLRFARADRQDGYRPQFGASAAWLATGQLALGAGYRSRPENQRFAREGAAYDLFGAWFVSHNLSLVLAYADLRGIANQGRQNGLYLSLQAGF